MRSENEAGAFLDSEAKSRKGLADARVVSDDSLLEGNVEVHADEDAFTFEVEVVDRELGHGVVTRDS